MEANTKNLSISDHNLRAKHLKAQDLFFLMLKIRRYTVRRKILDNILTIYYRSHRADENLLASFMKNFNDISKNPYQQVVFKCVDDKDNPIYHTNVVMAIFTEHVVLCTESIRDKKERDMVVQHITEKSMNSGKARKLIDINYEEMNNFCGNMIMIGNSKGEKCAIMSSRAKQNLRPHNFKVINENYRIVDPDLKIIETIGGGSARCMVAELF